ncbi:hypothetical protein [Mycolicibacterium sp. P9-64]|uniref:hypothetical protein n=1 Tax=Mycolicibacterium sp. P9-64 TaxID=2024612 RepID=UPI001F5BC7D4|nr:hypothetical protein [Mycolicibacterium sp. P9-64]
MAAVPQHRTRVDVRGDLHRAAWGEHLHYARLTGQDRLIEEAAERYTDGVPVSEHYLAVREVR